ncbi:MAG: hypothetical protein Q9198_010848, partial [Flavoplaca austrocitrina]
EDLFDCPPRGPALSVSNPHTAPCLAGELSHTQIPWTPWVCSVGVSRQPSRSTVRFSFTQLLSHSYLTFRAGLIEGHDPRDPTSISPLTRSRVESQISCRPRNKTLRIGIPREYLLKELDPLINKHWSLALQLLRGQGHSIHLVSLPTTKAALAAYYILAPAEASSNLAKYDGVRYGKRALNDRDKPNVLFSSTRGNRFGAEVRRRILLGSYTLSSTAIDNYFIRAQKVRRLVQDDFNKVFAMKHPLLQHQEETPRKEYDKEETGVDILITPTTLNLPPLLSSLQSDKNDDPTKQFQEDVYTVPASLAGLPAISVPVPCMDWKQVGLQVMGQYGDDERVLDAAGKLEELLKDAGD